MVKLLRPDSDGVSTFPNTVIKKPRLPLRKEVETWVQPPSMSVSRHDLIVCACGKQRYPARDAIDAAIFRGELEVKWKEFLEAVEAEKRSDELDVDLDGAAISSATEAFRYEYDLITAEETEAWLANRGLTLNDFVDYFARRCCANGFYEEIGPVEVEYQCASPELRLSLTRFETEIIELESRDAAKEAFFCVREDGMSMEEVAIEGRYPYRRADFILEDISLEAQQKFLCVCSGQVLKPIERGDGFELCRIVTKIEPRLEDPRVKSRIDQRLLDRHFSELVSKYVERRLGEPF